MRYMRIENDMTNEIPVLKVAQTDMNETAARKLLALEQYKWGCFLKQRIAECECPVENGIVRIPEALANRARRFVNLPYLGKGYYVLKEEKNVLALAANVTYDDFALAQRKMAACTAETIAEKTGQKYTESEILEWAGIGFAPEQIEFMVGVTTDNVPEDEISAISFGNYKRETVYMLLYVE